MSPRRLELNLADPDGTRTTQTIESEVEFVVGPIYAAEILNLPRTTLSRYDGPDVRRVNSYRGGVGSERLYPD
jgi:hypothetical protein